MQSDRDADERLAAVLEVSRDGLLLVDTTGRVTAANRAAAAMLRRELVGVRWDTVREAVAAGELEHVTAQLGGGGLVVCLRDGSEVKLLERKIGHNLHDGLGQLLTGTAFLAKGLESAVGEDYRPQAQRVVELINQAIARVRELARGLSAPPVETRSLHTILRVVVAESTELLGVDCRLELRSPVDVAHPATVGHVYLITREAITNAVRHGRADRVVVSLSRHGERLQLSIEDNGVGISDLVEPHTGTGLRSMRDRAHRIGGTLEVARAPVGTVVRCWWSA